MGEWVWIQWMVDGMLLAGLVALWVRGRRDRTGVSPQLLDELRGECQRLEQAVARAEAVVHGLHGTPGPGLQDASAQVSLLLQRGVEAAEVAWLMGLSRHDADTVRRLSRGVRG